MKKTLPLFPLNLVAFPGENLNLHIFEPRYKELVEECLESSSTFGIPAYIHNKLEMGTEVEIVELDKKYKDGRMDIRTQGIAIFEVLDSQNPIPGKLYSSGTVQIHQIDLDVDEEKLSLIRSLMADFYKLINIENPYSPGQITNSFSIAHKIGLSLEEEYELLKIPRETDRLDFILKHLQKTAPVAKEIEKTREIISQNGHFKRLGPIKF